MAERAGCSRPGGGAVAKCATLDLRSSSTSPSGTGDSSDTGLLGAVTSECLRESETASGNEPYSLAGRGLAQAGLPTGLPFGTASVYWT